MRLWTIQTAAAYKELNEKGILRVPDELTDKDFRRAYDWLVGEMCKRIGPPPKGVNYPLWAWHTSNGEHVKPDFKDVNYGEDGETMFLIEVEIPDEQVVLTDYNAWHYVLNRWWNDDSTCEEDWEERHAWFDSLPIAEQKRVTVASWQGIFNVTRFNLGKWRSNGYWVQATFWELRKENIISVDEFVCRDEYNLVS